MGASAHTAAQPSDMVAGNKLRMGIDMLSQAGFTAPLSAGSSGVIAPFRQSAVAQIVFQTFYHPFHGSSLFHNPLKFCGHLRGT